MNAIGCTFYQNTVNDQAATLQCNNGVMDVRECLFFDNASDDLSGGVYFYESSGLVWNNTFHGNSSPGLSLHEPPYETHGATIVVHKSPGVRVERNIISGDKTGYGLLILNLNDDTLHGCNVYWSNYLGAISGDDLAPDEQVDDPLFCNPGDSDFSIAYESPAAAPNSPCSVLIGAFEPACSGPVPVFVSFFEGVCVEAEVRLSWDIRADETILGFRLYRQREPFGELRAINDGQLLSPDDRSYTDASVTAGEVYRYRLAVVLQDNTETMSTPVEVEITSLSFVLEQNSPNPFNPSTTIAFTLPNQLQTRLSIYNIEGKEVATLVDQVLDGGLREVAWNGRDDRGNSVSSGVYFYRLTAGNQTLTKKMVFLK